MRLASWMPSVIAVLLAAFPASAQVFPPPLPSVDLGIHELRLQARLLSTRTEEYLWVLGDAQSAVRVARSTDAGRSWRVDAQSSEALIKALLAHSCFNVFGGVLSVQLSPGEALLSVERDQGGAEGKQVRERRKLSRGDGERIVRELVAAALREETMPDCDSTTVYSASIEWSCASGPIKKGSVRLNDSSCESRDPSSLMNVPPNAYSRTLGIHQVVYEVLERTSR